jgi:hypothetical protein
LHSFLYTDSCEAKLLLRRSQAVEMKFKGQPEFEERSFRMLLRKTRWLWVL